MVEILCSFVYSLCFCFMCKIGCIKVLLFCFNFVKNIFMIFVGLVFNVYLLSFFFVFNIIN